MSNGSMTRTVRSLSEGERARLQRNARAFERQAARAGRAALRVGGVLVAILWVVTLLASEAPWLVVTGFWVVVGAAVIWWAHRSLASESGDLGRMAGALRSALERSEAEEVRIRATALVELQEVEDEGACWAFQVGERQMVFLCGQQFYATASFPSLDVSLIHPLAPDGTPVDEWIEVYGPRAEPDRTIPPDRKWALEVPEHLEVVDAAPETLEEDLGPARD